MDPTMITYLGFFAAALIMLWAGVEISRRFYKREKINARVMNTWLPLEVTPSTETEDGEPDNDPPIDPHTRAQQNGHYSGSKKL